MKRVVEFNSLFCLIIFIFILFLAAGLRFYGLTYQSLWLDELQTMVGADPAKTWPEFFNYFACCDLGNPPLFNLLERLLFSICGYTAFTARALSAVAGVLGVWAIYDLGKEIKDRQLGLTAAALTAVNYFAVYYSQEARSYSLLFLFTALSYLYFIRMCRYFRATDTAWYLAASICLVYTHYFGLLVILCEGLIALLLLRQKANRKRLLWLAVISTALLFMAFIPLLPNFTAAIHLHSFWAPPVKPSFFIDFFNTYFGHSRRLLYTITALLLYYAMRAGLHYKSVKSIHTDATSFSFVFVALTIILPLAIPYARSVWAVPFLVPRYTIIILPSILIGVAYGIEMIGFRYLRFAIVAWLLIFSVYHLVVLYKYYALPRKTQFRELTAFITSDNHHNYPIVNEHTAWQQRYYLDLYHYTGRVFSGSKEDLVDSMLHKGINGGMPDTFWLIGAHHDPHLSTAKTKDLDSGYQLVQDTSFFDAWAQLYVKRR